MKLLGATNRRENKVARRATYPTLEHDNYDPGPLAERISGATSARRPTAPPTPPPTKTHAAPALLARRMTYSTPSTTISATVPTPAPAGSRQAAEPKSLCVTHFLLASKNLSHSDTSDDTYILPPTGTQNALGESHKKASTQQATRRTGVLARCRRAHCARGRRWRS